MDNGHSLAKLQILCAPPNVFAGILRAVGRFSPLASPFYGAFFTAAGQGVPMCSPSRGDCGGRWCEPPVSRRAVGTVWEKTGDFSAKTRENRRKVPAFFRKAPNGRCANGRTRLAPSRFVAIGRESCVRKRGPRPPVCLCRRLRCGEIAVIRRGKSESPLVRFDAKV